MHKPVPIPTETSAPYWDSLREHKISIQKCADCGEWNFYPRLHCPACLSTKLDWHNISGNGTLYSYSLSRVATAPEFSGDLPQKLAIIQLDEGPRLNSTLVFLDEDEIRIGMSVKPWFDDRKEDGITLLQFTGEKIIPPSVERIEEDVPAPEVEKREIRYDDAEAVKSLVTDAYSDWSNIITVSQDLINDFAELSGDNYWIHTDPEKAKVASPFGGTIAHGALVQILMTRFNIPLTYEIVGFNTIINYGSDRLRFPSPVLAGSRIHARARVKDVQYSTKGLQLTLEMNIHVVGQDKPAVINDMVIMYM